MISNESIIDFLAQPDNLKVALDLTERYEQRLIAPKDKIIGLLSQPNNLPIIHKTSESIDQVKDKLQKDFWLSLADNIRNRLTKSKNAKKWQVWIESEDRLCHPWTGLTLWPLETKPGQLLTVITLMQSPRQQYLNQLYYGIRWATADKPNGGGKLSKVPDLGGLMRLKSKLLEMGLRATDPHWLQYEMTDYKPASKVFLLRMATNKDELTEEVAQMIWVFFEEIKPYIQAANGDISTLNPAKLLTRPRKVKG